MPYFGKTLTEIDAHGPSSVKVSYPSEKEHVCIALLLGGTYVFLHNGELVFIEGKIKLCNKVERLQQSLGFSLDEDSIWNALDDWFVMDLVVRDELPEVDNVT